jgi:hypothetical protein
MVSLSSCIVGFCCWRSKSIDEVNLQSVDNDLPGNWLERKARLEQLLFGPVKSDDSADPRPSSLLPVRSSDGLIIKAPNSCRLLSILRVIPLQSSLTNFRPQLKELFSSTTSPSPLQPLSSQNLTPTYPTLLTAKMSDDERVTKPFKFVTGRQT